MLFIIYVNYGRGVSFRTGPIEARFRSGLWSHIYRRRHEHGHCSGCPGCMERVALGQVPTLPEGRQTGRMYRMV